MYFRFHPFPDVSRWGGGGGHFDPNLNRAVRLNPQMSRSCQFKIWLKWDLDLDKDEGEVERDGDMYGLGWGWGWHCWHDLRACDNGMVGGVWPKIDSHCDKEEGGQQGLHWNMPSHRPKEDFLEWQNSSIKFWEFFSFSAMHIFYNICCPRFF